MAVTPLRLHFAALAISASRRGFDRFASRPGMTASGFSQRSAAGCLETDRRRHSLFPFPAKEWSAGRRQSGVRFTALYGPLSGVRCALTAMSPLPRVAATGAREPTDGGPSASRRSTAAALSGSAPHLPPLPIRMTDVAAPLTWIETRPR